MTILVTGGTKGIGLAIADYLARPGEPIVLNYHSDDEAAAAADGAHRRDGRQGDDYPRRCRQHRRLRADHGWRCEGP